MAEPRITPNTAVSLGILAAVVGGAITLTVTFSNLRHDVDLLRGDVGKIVRDVDSINQRIVGRGCHGVHRPQLLSFAQTLKRDNPQLKVPNPYNPQDVPFPPDPDCFAEYDRNDEP